MSFLLKAFDKESIGFKCFIFLNLLDGGEPINFLLTFNFLRKLFYHDLYLLYPKLKADNIKKIKFHKGSNYMKIFIKEKSKIFYFQYELGKKKYNKINNINLNSKKDYISIMMKKVFLSRVNFKKNQLSAINTMKILEMTKNAKFHSKLF